MGYVPKAYADDTQGWTVEVLGENISATMQKQPLFDSNMSRMRS
jgi:dimethylglycine dehydrogenase